MSAESALEAKVRANFQAISSSVADAATRSGRDGSDIRIVGVTKYVGVEGAKALVRAGCLDLGESRPQGMWEKSDRLPAEVRWHLIGHVQRNKVRRSLPRLHLLHSLDSMRLAVQLVEDAKVVDVVVRALLEINLTEDGSKTGMSFQAAEDLVQRYSDEPAMRERLQLVGLMGMSSLNGGADRVRREFASLREWRDRWNARLGLGMTELSMGMSEDFEIGIEEGSTLVRIGSRLFQGVECCDKD
jgi:pyridoxal phosphate enzyme (YggS family)